MADFDIRATTTAGQPQVRRSDKTSLTATEHGHFKDVPSMKAYLGGLGKGYTAERLHAMTFNDLVYATKLELGIKA